MVKKAWARYISDLSDDVIKETIQTEILDEIVAKNDVRSRPLPRLRSVMVSRWDKNPYELGSYSYLTVDAEKAGIRMSDLSAPLTDPSSNGAVKRVLFAGEACSDIHYGTVHGAINTAVREINSVLHQNKRSKGDDTTASAE